MRYYRYKLLSTFSRSPQANHDFPNNKIKLNPKLILKYSQYSLRESVTI